MSGLDARDALLRELRAAIGDPLLEERCRLGEALVRSELLRREPRSLPRRDRIGVPAHGHRLGLARVAIVHALLARRKTPKLA